MTTILPALSGFTRAHDEARLLAARVACSEVLGAEWPLSRTCEPPWAAWALRASDELGLGDVAATVAVAVAAMTFEGRAEEEARGLVARWAAGAQVLAHTITDMGRYQEFQRWLAAVAVATRAAGDLPVVAWKLRLVFGAPAWCAGVDAAPWTALGAELAPAVALLASFERFWLAPDGVELASEPAAAWLACALDAAPAATRLALAGVLRAPARREEVRAVLERPEVEQEVRRRFAASVAAARAALTSGTAALGRELIDSLEALFARAMTYLFARGLARAPASATAFVRPWTKAECRKDIQRALERLEREPTWDGCVDAQRWGVAPVAADVAADWFPRGLIEIALDETAGGRAARISALLGEVAPGDLRYYRNFRFVPPDVDSLGLALELAARLPEPPVERLASWLALLRHNLGADGVPHVWLVESQAGPTYDAPAVEWAGDRCTACLLRLLLGLRGMPSSSELGVDRAPLERALVHHVLGCLGAEGFAGCHHYPPEYALHLFFRVAACLDDARVRAARARLTERLLARQRLDGSWGSPQQTAWLLEALCLARPERSAVERAARYLSETQRGDGAWHAELVYYTVGKPGLMTEYRSLEVTTAMCARALRAAERALE